MAFLSSLVISSFFFLSTPFLSFFAQGTQQQSVRCLVVISSIDYNNDLFLSLRIIPFPLNLSYDSLRARKRRKRLSSSYLFPFLFILSSDASTQIIPYSLLLLLTFAISLDTDAAVMVEDSSRKQAYSQCCACVFPSSSFC